MILTRILPKRGTLAHRAPRAFTLVELLTVIIIIGILMAILVPAVMSARVKALDTRMINEIAQLDSALKQFRTNYAVLPPATHYDDNGATPNGTIENRVRAFWRRAWPRWNNTATPVAALDPPEVLAFYLGGMPATAGSSKVTGFNLNPLSPQATGGQRSTPLFQFDQGRLLDEDGDGLWEYYPPQKRSVGDGVLPYFYFDTGSYSDDHYVDYSVTPPNTSPAVDYLLRPNPSAGSGAVALPCSQFGFALPYLDGAVSGGFMNPNAFQIIGAGLDEHYGANANKTFPAGTNYATEDNDNLSNFSTVRLEDAKP
jgi:prepilin-type N-terminal cleavage/methylation domain-containing protein